MRSGRLMIILPRLARAFNKPAIAALLGVILVAVAIIGLVSGDMRTGLAIIVLAVGTINVIRAIPQRDTA
jgi:hypothetical protein